MMREETALPSGPASVRAAAGSPPFPSSPVGTSELWSSTNPRIKATFSGPTRGGNQWRMGRRDCEEDKDEMEDDARRPRFAAVISTSVGCKSCRLYGGEGSL